MRSITPRTCLWPVTFTLIGTFALSIGLTFRSDRYCYAAVCGEVLFPLQARLHVVVWYLWISLSVGFLGLRAFHPSMRKTLQHPLFERKVPIVGKHFSVSGLLVIGWIVLLYGIATGIWWSRVRDYFVQRGDAAGVTSGNLRLAAIALTGHYCDITMGMVLLPISRHSALASFFKLSASTTLAFHMIQAYTLFFLILVHGFLYVSWVPVFNSLSAALKTVYPVLNPTYSYYEAWPGNTSSLSIWRASLPFSGLATTVILLLIFITTLPAIRKTNFNVFYFTHLTTIVAVIIVCLHASTMFYMTAPGLILWIVDWGMRVYELWDPVDGRVTSIGNGYYALDMTMPRNRLDGCACTSPLAHFYIYHSDSSSRELHPFTTITHLASENVRTPPEESELRIQFLFRKSSNILDHKLAPIEEHHGLVAALRALVRPKRKQKVQWTEKLASHADTKETDLPMVTPTASKDLEGTKSRQSSMTAFGDDHQNPIIPVGLRLEGPYFTPADPSRYHTVICLVAGTGISGGIAIANAFMEMEKQRADNASAVDGISGASCIANAAKGIWSRCIIVWSVREGDYVDMPWLTNNKSSNLEVQVQLTGNGRKRLDFDDKLESILDAQPSEPSKPGESATIKEPRPGRQSTWVYLSGPMAYIESGEKACKAAGVDYYGARWDI